MELSCEEFVEKYEECDIRDVLIDLYNNQKEFALARKRIAELERCVVLGGFSKDDVGKRIWFRAFQEWRCGVIELVSHSSESSYATILEDTGARFNRVIERCSWTDPSSPDEGDKE